ncbi:MAG: hypothetical protein QW394_10215 [Thermofilaceae archaeon]
MVELKRGVEKRVAVSIDFTANEIRGLIKWLGCDVAIPEAARFSDGRVGYFILTEAGSPYLAYALFSMDEPRDEKERLLLGRRSVSTFMDILLERKALPRVHSFLYNYINIADLVEDEMRHYVEWAERLTLEDVKAMLEKLEELERQQRVEPEIVVPPEEYLLEELKKLAGTLRWFLDEQTRAYGSLVVSFLPRLDEPGFIE